MAFNSFQFEKWKFVNISKYDELKLLPYALFAKFVENWTIYQKASTFYFPIERYMSRLGSHKKILSLGKLWYCDKYILTGCSWAQPESLIGLINAIPLMEGVGVGVVGGSGGWE